jgi:hypothetical protein
MYAGIRHKTFFFHLKMFACPFAGFEPMAFATSGKESAKNFIYCQRILSASLVMPWASRRELETVHVSVDALLKFGGGH